MAKINTSPSANYLENVLLQEVFDLEQFGLAKRIIYPMAILLAILNTNRKLRRTTKIRLDHLGLCGGVMNTREAQRLEIKSADGSNH